MTLIWYNQVMKIQTIILSEQNNTIELIKLYLEETGKFEFLTGTSDFLKACSFIKSNSNMLIIADLSGYQEQTLNFISKINAEFPNVRFLAISDKLNTDIVIRSMRVGATDFISMPLIKAEFNETLDKIYTDISGGKPKKSKCRVISVYSNKGGVGKTSIATNLAVEISKITKENVALVDLNFQSGDVTTFLDLKPAYNISYMLQNLDKINEEFLLSTLEKYKDTSLYILSDPPFLKQVENIPLKNISKLIEKLRDTFSYVIVDTSANFDNKSVKTLEESDLVFFVTIVNLPALRNCQRCLEMFEKLGFPKDKIQIIVNRFMENDEITSDDVEEVTGKEIYWKIPNNYFTMMSSINKGVPASQINSDSNVALSFKSLALNITDNIYKKRNNYAE